MCLVVWLFLSLRLVQSAGGGSTGEVAFTVVSFLAFGYSALAGFFFTADSISSERREGTLPLLFHSQTNVIDITLGKFLGLSLAPIYGLVAILPFFSLSMLDGGITFVAVAAMAGALLFTLLFSLAAGLLASAVSRDEDAGYIRLVLLLAAPAMPFGLGVAAVIVAGTANGLSSSRARVGCFTLAVLAIVIGSAAAWITGDLWVGLLYNAWRLALESVTRARPAGSLAISLLLLAGNTLLCIGAASVFLNPNGSSAYRGGPRSLRNRGRQSSDPIRLVLRRTARGAVVLVWVATILELIGALLSIWSSFLTTTRAGTILYDLWALVLAQLLLHFALARLAIVNCAVFRQNRTFELLFSTPLRLANFLAAAQKVFWRAVVPTIVVLALIQWGQMIIFMRQAPSNVWVTFIPNFLHVVLYVPLFAAMFWVGNYFVLRFRRTGVALLLTLALVLVVPAVVSYFAQILMARVLIPLLESYGASMSSPVLFNLAPTVSTAIVLLAMLRWARWKIVGWERQNAWGEML